MAKKIISIAFNKYCRETKNYHVYEKSDEHEFFPKYIHVSKKDVKDPVKKVTVNIIAEEA